MITFTLKVELGALIEVPSNCWETHKRGKNWCATISKDPDSPGGLARAWWQHCRGDFYYKLPEGLKSGTPVEFGADYYNARGNPNRSRRYFVITKVEPSEISLLEYHTAVQAINAARKFIPGMPQPGDVHKCDKIKEIGLRLVANEEVYWDLYKEETNLGQVNFCPGCGMKMDIEKCLTR